MQPRLQSPSVSTGILMRLARRLFRPVPAPIPAALPGMLVGGDAAEGPPGRKAHGKAWYRDPVRSSHGLVTWRYGHRWVALNVLVRFPWVLPGRVDPNRRLEDDKGRGHSRRIPAGP